MKTVTSKKKLQWVIRILAAAPLLSGLIGLAGIYNPLFNQSLPENLILDSNLRFLNAMSIAVALSFYYITPVIEKETTGCRIICSTIFLGGLGRLISIFDLGLPPVPFIVFLVVELTSPIIIVFWQKKLASEYQNAHLQDAI
ncbi:DUF4345 domain-containing protein [Dyadobacter sp. CY356]|uniref:DUF4345 domain-containing protein n=1 Tax=Dyadobacter sp. CY356 TaxID=2906442 RepID=UPI001F3C9DB2|nr:DUF4345 domain-containing protein [Dyadobacter sp. CY356]MCF0054529.1 DUF4345 domain-containing protein [Dyadobacter sp. CY356]